MAEDPYDEAPKLTPKQELFCIEFHKDMNATQAAIRAGYSPKTAAAAGSRLLRFVKVSQRLKLVRDEIMSNAKNEAEEILNELRKIAYFDIGKCFDENGMLLPFHKMPEGTRRALAGVETEELFEGFGKDREHIGQLKKIKGTRPEEKLRALELLGRRHSLFVEEVKHSGEVKLSDSIKAARKRAAKRE